MEGVKTVSIFGATGSIGRSTCDVINAARGQFKVRHVTAHSNAKKLAALAIEMKAECAVIADESLYGALKTALDGHNIEASAGRGALLAAASEKTDIVMAAIVGMAGLEPLLKSIENGGIVAIANKEPLVAAGALVMEAAQKSGAQILPVDSEHNAVFQVFDDNKREDIERIILTASGGPFRTWSSEKIAKATPAEAIAHPNWSMGQKISVDSASLMNKALEVIEAHFLFNMPPEKIDVVVHPQSTIHSMVEYRDGSILSQMGASDMRTPIAYALGWPNRIKTPGQTLDLSKGLSLNFEPLDNDKFPSVSMAYDALNNGAAACIGFNAANEVAVHAFLSGDIAFGNIMNYVEKGLDIAAGENFSPKSLKSLEEIIGLDQTVRLKIGQMITKNKKVYAS